MKQVIVGTYEIGYEQIELVLREDTGGEFWLIPEKGLIPRIKIGANQDEFRMIISTLLHEAIEFLCTRNLARYEPRESMTNDHSQYLFVFNHVQLSHMCSCVAQFIIACWSDLQRAWLNFKTIGR